MIEQATSIYRKARTPPHRAYSCVSFFASLVSLTGRLSFVDLSDIEVLWSWARRYRGCTAACFPHEGRLAESVEPPQDRPATVPSAARRPPATAVGDMSGQPVRVLISGASNAGPTVAYWLSRQGFAVTVVERMPLTRVRSSGHAVDPFGPAMDVAEWTGVLPAVMDARTRTEIVSFQRDNGRGGDVEMSRLIAGIPGRHIEIMRGELATILYEATRLAAQYLFEDSISMVAEESDGVAVTFNHAARRPVRSRNRS
jgi:hypothetical protein